MPFVKKNDSKGSQLSIDAQKVFIGRNTELHFFTENILKPKDPTYNIVSVSGQGGVGKSTLLTRFIEEACKPDFKDYCLTALINERQTTPSSMIEKFAEQLPMGSAFDTALRRYKEVLRKLQDEREAARAALLRKTAMDLSGEAVKDVPFVGGILQEGAGAAAGYLFDELRYRQLLKDAERQEDPIGDLTRAFVAELNRLTDLYIQIGSDRTKHRLRVILCFDTFEQLAAEAVPWLLNSFLEAEITNQVVLVIAGRDTLERSTPDDPKRWLPYYDSGTIYSIALNSFTEEETRVYLEEQGITDPDRIDTIWKLSHGLPLYLGLLLISNEQGTVDPTANVVANFLRWIPEQESIKRQLALDAALFSKTFNQDDLEAFTYLPEQERPALYSWLIGLPFVRPQDGHYLYHEIARDLFSRHLYQRSKKAYYTSRRALADYYQQSLEQLQQERGKEVDDSRESLELVLALAYQLFILPDEVSHIQAIEQLLNAWYKYGEQTAELVKVLRDISQEQSTYPTSPSTRQIATQLLRYIEAIWGSREALTALSALLEYVVHAPLFSTELLVQLYHTRGEAYLYLSEQQQAFKDFRRILELTEPTEYGSRGRLHWELQEYQQAITNFDHALELNPNDASILVARGFADTRLHEYQQAIANFDRALEIDPDNTSAYNGQGWTYLNSGELEQATKAFDHALELDPNLTASLRGLGLTYSALSEYQRAIATFDHYLELDDKNPFVYTDRGECYSSLKEYQRAIADFDQALELSPKHLEAYNGQGWTYLNSGELEQATKAFDHALELDPNFTASLRGLGLTYFALSEYQRAIATFDRYLELDDKNPFVYTDRGNCYSALNEYQQAIKDFDRALELDPKKAAAYNERGRIYRKLGEYQLAVATFDRFIEEFPTNYWAHFQRGWTYLWLKEIRQARADFTKSWELDSTVVWNGWMTEWARLCQERPDSAMAKRLDTIAASDPQNYWAYVCRGAALWLWERFEEALTEIERAIVLEPMKSDAHFWKGVACASLDLNEEAMAAIEEALALELPPVLLTTLCWFEQQRPDFYRKYVVPLLASMRK